MGRVSGSGGGQGIYLLVYGPPAVRTVLLTRSGIRPCRLPPQRSVGRGLARGPSPGGWRNYPAKVVVNYRKEEVGGRPRISYV